MALATAGALAILGRLIWALTEPAPPLDVEFVGVHANQARCHGNVATEGHVAWAACDLPDREQALVELDPETARASLLHRWKSTSGNPPALQILHTCGGGELFVVGNGDQQTTLVTRRAGQVHAWTAPVGGRDVLGADCDGTGVDLLIADTFKSYATLRVTDAGSEQGPSIPSVDIDGRRIVAAWREAGSWQLVTNDFDGKFGSGPLGAKRSPIAGESQLSVCPIGPPGGWLGVSRSGGCLGHAALLTHRDGVFHVEEVERILDSIVVDVGPQKGHVLTFLAGDDDDWQIRGRGALDLDLRRNGRMFEAQRADAPPVVVVNASSSAFAIKLRVLPLSDDRVAVWGGLGGIVMILGPDLRRLDGPGLLQRITSPVEFVFKNTSSSERRSYYVAVLAALAWLIALATFRRTTTRHHRYRLAAILTVVVLAVCASSFLKIVKWL